MVGVTQYKDFQIWGDGQLPPEWPPSWISKWPFWICFVEYLRNYLGY